MGRQISSHAVYAILESAINAISGCKRELDTLTWDVLDRQCKLKNAASASGEPEKRLYRVIWQTLETHYCDASALSEELCSILSALYAIRNSSFTPSGDDEEDEKPPF